MKWYLSRCILLCSLGLVFSIGPANSCKGEEVVATVNLQLSKLLESTDTDVCDRSTFLRRVSLDLIGRVPTAAEAREFARNDTSESREQVVERLSRSPAVAKRLAIFVRAFWFPQTSVAPYEYLAKDTEAWIVVQLRQSRPLNRIAEDLIAVSYAPQATEDKSEKQIVLSIPKTIIEANDHRPERMAANATGDFLGVNLSCAQCHDHPFGSWTQDQFWQTAAFFVPMRRHAEDHRRWDELTIEIPDSGRSVHPVLFTSEDMPHVAGLSRVAAGREVFASWLSGLQNPYFARWTVNQLWAEYFGEPLVTIQPSLVAHPAREETLNTLTAAFIEHEFDLLWLAQTIVLTDAYQTQCQLESTIHKSDYPYAMVRGLTGSQLYDSLSIAAGRPPIRPDLDTAEKIQKRDGFLNAFPTDRSVDVERSATQVLSLMNGGTAEELCNLRSNPLIHGLANAPFLSEQECVESMFWATLGRSPSDPEWKMLRASKYLDDDPSSRGKRLSTLFWVLVNTVEFNTNH